MSTRSIPFPRRRFVALAASAFAVLAGLSLVGCERGETSRSPDAAAKPAPTLTIAAASSLKELLEGTGRTFAAAHDGVLLRFSFDASSALSRQIEAGGGFECFLSADAANVDRLGAKVDAASRASFLSNHLVVVVRGDLKAPIAGPEALRDLPGRIALAGEAVPVGKYARTYLTRKGLLKDIEHKVVNGDNVRAVLALVESGAADAGVVYATDARVAVQAKLAFTVPAADDPGIEYVAAAVAGSSTLARDYIKWLRSGEFQEAAEKLGFVRVSP